MSEEEQQETVQEAVQQEEPQAEPSNPIFDALYDVSQEVASEEPEEEEPISAPSSLMSALHDLENEPQDQASSDTQAESVQQDEEAVAEAPKPKHKIKRKVVDPDPKVDRPVRRQQRKKVETEDPYISSLVGAEKDKYELAKWASKNLQGHETSHTDLLNFYKAQENFIKEQKEMNPHMDLRDSEEIRNFKKNNHPKINLDSIKDEKILQTAEERAVKRLSGEMNRQKQEIHRAKTQPKFEQLSKKLRAKIIEAVPTDLIKPIQENFKEYASTNPVEAKIMHETMTSGVELGDEFHKITTGMTGFDDKNPAHLALKTFIEREQNNFINSGKTKRGGKTFIRRERMGNVPQADKDKYYTFTDDDIIQLIIKRAGDSINRKLKGFHETMQKSGYIRQGQPQVAVPEQNVQPQRPPSVPPPSPRAGNIPTQSPPKEQPNKVMELLGL